MTAPEMLRIFSYLVSREIVARPTL
jgi:hypothetical protein